jgi:hypothetical protein
MNQTANDEVERRKPLKENLSDTKIPRFKIIGKY